MSFEIRRMGDLTLYNNPDGPFALTKDGFEVDLNGYPPPDVHDKDVSDLFAIVIRQSSWLFGLFSPPPKIVYYKNLPVTIFVRLDNRTFLFQMKILDPVISLMRTLFNTLKNSEGKRLVFNRISCHGRFLCGDEYLLQSTGTNTKQVYMQAHFFFNQKPFRVPSQELE